MAPIDKEPFKPSLRRLQSLDSDYEDLEERLHHAARIAGLPSGPRDEIGPTNSSSGPRRGGHSRAEWVLKWTLDKLKSKDVSIGTQSRALPTTWELLSKLVAFVPASTAARALNAGEILVSLQRALDERVILEERRLANGASKAPSSPEPSGAASKKRKRSDIAPVKTADTTPLEHFYRDVSQFLTVIITRAQSGVDNTVDAGREHLNSVLRAHTSLAARLLKSWMILTQHLILSEEAKSSPSLVPFLSIWNLRSTSADDEFGNSSAAFSSECVEAATLLYATLLDLLEHSQSLYETYIHGMIHDVENLLTSHVLIPARSAFFAAQQQHAARRFMILALAENLTPLGRAISSCTDQSSAKLGHFLDVIPKLFKLALRNSPRSTPKQQSAEASWLEACLDVLAGCSGQPISDDFDSVPNDAFQSEAETPLEIMLQLLKDQKTMLNSEFLRSIVLRYSGLPKDDSKSGSDSKQAPPGPAVRWFLVSRILDLDSDIFLDSPATILAPTSTSKTKSLSFVEPLISRMSSKRWGSSKTSEAHITDAFGQDRTYFVSEVVVRLMNAFATARDLAGFMLHWFTEVSTWVAESSAREEQSTVWLSSDLVQAFGSIMETSLTPAQIADLLEQYTIPLDYMVKECDANLPKSNESAQVQLTSLQTGSAALVVLDAILTGIERDETLSKCKTPFNALSTLLQSLLHYRIADFQFESRAWRLLTRIFSLQAQAEDSAELFIQGSAVLNSDMFQVAQQSIERHGKMYPDGDLDTCSEAFGFVATCSTLLSIRGLEPAPKTLETAAQSLISIGEEQYSETVDRITLFDRPAKKLVYRLQDFAIKLPQCLTSMKSDQRRFIFADALKTAVVSTHEPYEKKIVQGSKLRVQGLQEAVLDLASYNVLSDWLAVLLSSLDSMSEDPQQHLAIATQTQVESLLLRLDPSGIPRNKSDGFYNREAFIDRLLNSLHPFQDRCMRTLSTVSRLMSVPNPTSRLGSDAAALWDLATFLDNYPWTPTSDQSLLQAFEDIATAVFRQADIDSLRERNQKYFEKFNTLTAERFVSGATHIESFKERLGTLALIKCRLLKNTSNLSGKGTGSGDSLNLSRDCLLAVGNLLRLDIGRLSQSADIVTNDVAFPLWSSSVLSAAERFIMVGDAFEPSVLSYVKPLVQTWSLILNKTISRETSPEEMLNSTEIDWSAYATVLPSVFSSMDLNDVLSSAANVLATQDLSIQDQRHFIDAFCHWSKEPSISAAQRLHFIQSMALPESEPPLKYGNLRLRGYMISGLENQELVTDETRNQAKSILPSLAIELGQAENIESFGNTLMIINRILRQKSFMISQFGVEKLISTLTTIATTSSKALPKQYGASIYLRLCQTTNTLIDMHRKKLGGRFHVLVPLLQALLTCLFAPHSSAKLPTSKAPPSWLASRISILDSEHGASYTRILTTLTQPTVTSAAGTRAHFLPNKTPDLVDQTKIARQNAAQFVPYVILHFCSMQLVGRLDDGVRQALMPGLWACIDAVPREALRGMSSGMGRDDREIWSALWADYIRVNDRVID